MGLLNGCLTSICGVRALLVMLVLLSGCQKNRDVLQARLVELERRLRDEQSSAEKLNGDRRALEAAEQELASTLAQFPEEKAAVEALEEPAFVPPVLPALPPLPEESALEGVEGARLRGQIATEARLAQLAKILAELEKLNARRRHVQRQLELVRERGAHRKP